MVAHHRMWIDCLYEVFNIHLLFIHFQWTWDRVSSFAAKDGNPDIEINIFFFLYPTFNILIILFLGLYFVKWVPQSRRDLWKKFRGHVM